VDGVEVPVPFLDDNKHITTLGLLECYERGMLSKMEYHELLEGIQTSEMRILSSKKERSYFSAVGHGIGMFAGWECQALFLK
jgi:hypothetical protein